MQFKPKTEEEVKRLFDKGQYRFTVMDAKETLSKTSGRPMIELDLELRHSNFAGKTNRIKCYLMTDEPNFEFLIRHFCYAVGMSDAYESGNLNAPSLTGKEGIALIGVKKDKSGTYPDQNNVLDFIVDESANKSNIPFNDDIPFG